MNAVVVLGSNVDGTKHSVGEGDIKERTNVEDYGDQRS